MNQNGFLYLEDVTQTTKRALVLSGGGSKGAFQVGKILQLTEQADFKSWDIISGVSVGAINAGFLAMFNKEDQHLGALGLRDLWLKHVTGNSSVYHTWAPGLLTYIPAIWKGSLFSTAPLKSVIVNNIDHYRCINSNVTTTVGTCSINTGKYKTVSKSDLHFLDYILASASFPIAFPAVEIDGDLYTDGGVRTVIPIMDAISLGATDIDVIMTSPPEHVMRSVASSAIRKIVPFALRVTDILLDEVFMADVARIQHEHKVNIRVHAPRRMPSKTSLDFNGENVRELLEAGYLY